MHAMSALLRKNNDELGGVAKGETSNIHDGNWKARWFVIRKVFFATKQSRVLQANTLDCHA